MIGALSSLAAIGWHVFDRFHVGDRFAISPHGVGIAVGFLAGTYVLLHEAPKREITEEQAGTMATLALVGAIVGARLFYVIGHFSEFDGIADMLAIYRGGISLIGGIVGAVLLNIPYMRRRNLPFLRVMDSAAIGLPLGIVIGRIGDLIIGDHLGKPTSWLLAFQYHGGNLSGYDCTSVPGTCSTLLFGGHTQVITARGATLFGSSGDVVAGGVGVHQTALYDFMSTMLLVALLVFLNRRHRRTGILFLTFAAWYGMGRIVTDFLRVDKTFFGMTGSQWTSLVVVLACGATAIWFALHPARPKHAISTDRRDDWSSRG